MPLQVAHSVRGRLRVRYPAPWLRDRHGELQTRLQQLGGVRAVAGSPLTGSLRIDYDPQRLSEAELLAALPAAPPERIRRPNAPAQGVNQPRRAPQRAPGLAASLIQLVTAGTLAASPWFPVAAGVHGALLVVAGLPLVLRGAGNLLDRRRLDGDILEAVTYLALALRGQAVGAGLLAAFRALGDALVARTARKAHRSLRELMTPWAGTVWSRDGSETPIPLDALRVGEVIGVGPDQVLPVDGTVARGAVLVNQQTLTGEALPVERHAGDPVFAGTEVVDGTASIRIERLGATTAAGRIIEAIEQATAAKSDIQSTAEVLADRQAPRTLVLAALGAAFSRSVDAGIAILVADYGLAAKVGVPTAVLTSLVRASRAGVLIKGPAALESLARVDTVVVDKTGTLTTGTPRVARVIALAGRDETTVIALAAAAERGLAHPVARAIARLARERGVRTDTVSPAALVVGLGAEVRVGGERVLVGGRRFMEERGVGLEAAKPVLAEADASGGSSTFLAVNGRLAGVLVLDDELRDDAPGLIDALRTQGMREVVMVTGDHVAAARVVAERLGLPAYHADLLPEDKAALIRRLKADGRVVAMIGDGVNDALALNEADVGIGIGGGPEVVAEAADIVLLQGDLSGIPLAFDLARRTVGDIQRTVRAAARANMAVVGLASLGLARPSASILISRGVTLGAAAVGAARPGRRPSPRRRSA